MQSAATVCGSKSGHWVFGNGKQLSGGISLFCFPFAGGGASFYSRWKGFFPEYVHVLPIQLPGREDRIEEEALKDARTLFYSLHEGLKPYMNSRFAFWGHSMGGLIAASYTAFLERMKEQVPCHVFLSSSGSPEYIRTRSLGINYTNMLELSDGIPKTVKSNAELMEAFRKTAEADCCLVKSLSMERFYVNAPVSVFGGTEDRIMSVSGMLSWKNYCRGGYESRLFGGGHFFINSHCQEIVY